MIARQVVLSVVMIELNETVRVYERDVVIIGLDRPVSVGIASRLPFDACDSLELEERLWYESMKSCCRISP